VVLADAGRGDSILCQITSQPYGDTGAVTIEPSDLASGSLRVTSFARPGKLFTAHEELLVAQIAVLKPPSFTRVVDAVVNLLRASTST
jgi:mRNA interferase MazF